MVRHCIYIALSGTVFELFDVEKYRDLDIWVRGHCRSFKLIPFESLGTVSYSPSIVTMANGSILHRLQDKTRYWSKIVIFSYHPLHLTLPLGSEYCHPVWYEQTRMVGVTAGEKNFEDTCNRLVTIAVSLTVYEIFSIKE